MKITEIKSHWSLWGKFYNVGVPSSFTFTWQDPEKKKEELRDLPRQLNSRPPGCEGSLFSISDDAHLQDILEDREMLVVRVESNPGSGSWSDAVYLLQRLDDEVWKGTLQLAGMGSKPRNKNPSNCHSKFMLREFKNGVLSYICQRFDDEKVVETEESIVLDRPIYTVSQKP